MCEERKKNPLWVLLSKNTVWVLTWIPQYLRVASLSCFAVKWLPHHQWNNNWCDNRFIWAFPSLWCHFVEQGAKLIAADTFGSYMPPPSSVYVEDKGSLYRLTNSNDNKHCSLIMQNILSPQHAALSLSPPKAASWESLSARHMGS